MKKILSYILITFFCFEVSAEKSYKFRLYLADKEGTEFSLDHPGKFLSQRAIDRRKRQNLKLDSTDLPISQQYLLAVSSTGVRIAAKSKWNNTIVIEVNDSGKIAQFAEMPFISKVKRVWIAPDSIPQRNANRKKDVTDKNSKRESYYGDAYRQIHVHNGDSLHNAGFKGKNMHIAVIDAGFYNVDEIKLFKKINLLGTRDFVNPNSDIYAENSHGMKVLSCLAANKPNVMVGTAPEASYWLLRSEDNDTEFPVEEDYWAAAVEFADSVGVDVINTSLGYAEFDDKSANYRYRDLDGKSSLMSNSASMLADKGMVLVNSAGNSGRKPWKKISPPADAKNIITVGAVTRGLINSDFSSVGDTSDGRTKPDAMAVGVSSAIVSESGTVSLGNGTSFSSPILCGIVADFWQACPWLTAKQVVEAVQRAGDRYIFPDNIYGFGVPDMWKAYKEEVKNNEKNEK